MGQPAPQGQPVPQYLSPPQPAEGQAVVQEPPQDFQDLCKCTEDGFPGDSAKWHCLKICGPGGGRLGGPGCAAGNECFMAAEIAAVANGWETHQMQPDKMGNKVAQKTQEIGKYCCCYAALTCLCAESCYHSSTTSKKLRERFGLKPNQCGDCTKHYFLRGCALQSEHKFIRTKFQATKWGQFAGGESQTAPLPAGPARQMMS